jgi:hypothetical protein
MTRHERIINRKKEKFYWKERESISVRNFSNPIQKLRENFPTISEFKAP